MRRRDFIKALAGLVTGWPLVAHAQRDKKLYRIGFIAPAPLTALFAMMDALRETLRQHGYIEDQNVVIEYRWLNGTPDENTAIIRELATSVDVILAWSSPAVLAARRATSKTPIVMVGVADPVGLGLVDSLARPGGNITGTTNIALDLSSKLVELLIDIRPDITRFGVVRNPGNPGVALQLRETETSIRTAGRDLVVIDAGKPQEYAGAFARFTAEHVGAVILLADVPVIMNAKMIAELAQDAKLPTAFQRRENVEAGGLLSYGPNLPEQFRQAAVYIERILKGEKPSELPVEQPTKFELVINLKTAKTLDLRIPQTLLATADEVIE
jgi:putative ABC transport system substrate-binding protein